METLQIALIIVLIVATIFFYMKAGYASFRKENSFIYLAGWLVVSSISFLIIFIQIEKIDKLEKETKKCPEYKKIENVYQKVN